MKVSRQEGVLRSLGKYAASVLGDESAYVVPHIGNAIKLERQQS